MWKFKFRLMTLAVSFLLVACAPRVCCVSSRVPPEADWNEYVIYRIDDHRFISIRSPDDCNGHLDGNIYYNDTNEGVHTYISFTGSASNGLYRGYYVVHSNPKYIAIPSRSFSEISGMKLHINYSHDGGRTFQWFANGGSDRHSVIIVDNKSLYLTRKNFLDSNDYRDDGASLFDIGIDMDANVAKYDLAGTFGKYAKEVSHRKIPFDLMSPSGMSHWTCPSKSGG